MNLTKKDLEKLLEKGAEDCRETSASQTNAHEFWAMEVMLRGLLKRLSEMGENDPDPQGPPAAICIGHQTLKWLLEGREDVTIGGIQLIAADDLREGIVQTVCRRLHKDADKQDKKGSKQMDEGFPHAAYGCFSLAKSFRLAANHLGGISAA